MIGAHRNYSSLHDFQCEANNIIKRLSCRKCPNWSVKTADNITMCKDKQLSLPKTKINEKEHPVFFLVQKSTISLKL